jgi:hypothetical protein
MSATAKLTIGNLAGGELAALIERAFMKIAENVADPNVPTEAVRKIKVLVKVKPDKKGQSAQITFNVNTELPGSEPGQAVAFIAMDQKTKEITLYSADVRQESLFASPQEPVMTEIKPVGEVRTAPGPTIAAIAPPMKSAN